MAFEGLLEILKAACPLVQELPHNEEGPAVTHQLERLGHWAGLIIVLWHRSLHLVRTERSISQGIVLAPARKSIENES